ncbi:MAG: EAL domain-containing protein, partial [Firmicutes bacterium]|nr:EAL domain-containing protein [Bacillota bacterium]
MEKYLFPEAEQLNIEHSMMPFALYQFIDKRVVTVAVSKGFCRLFGYEDKESAYYDMDNNMYKDTHPDDIARISDAALRFATEGGSYDVIYRSKNKDGGYNIIHAQGEHVYMPGNERVAQVWYTNEGLYDENIKTTEDYLNNSLKKALYEDSIIKASYYDHLTGLPSMTYFFELACMKRDEILKNGGSPALAFMDFSGMKYFNHKYGFEEGDSLLRTFARMIAQHFGNENCCRLGQDHYAVITVSDGLEYKLNVMFEECKRLNNGLSLPLHVGIYPDWAEDTITSVACDRAKFACDTLKSEFESVFIYYDPPMKEAEEKQRYIIANIDKAIAERWIDVYYQPIVRAVSGKVCDEEALARWIDPVKGFMSPADFIPVLEEHKLIYKLDLYVVERVLEKIKTIAEAGLYNVSQSVNLSRSDFDCCDMVEEIRRRVDEAGVSRSLLNIEITESIIGMDLEFIKEQTERFKELGFAVWMDDFGSGYSSLDVLQDFRFDLVKFDMRFMQKFEQGDKGKVILTELIKMATSLDIDTVCEGVETQEQVQFLQEAGCCKLQGYYFNKPIPIEKILEKYKTGLQIGFENPAEAQYYEDVGRINLHDLSVIAQNNLNDFGNFFNTLPMAVIEINGDNVRFARTNQSYRDFMMRQFAFTINSKPEAFHKNIDSAAPTFMKALFESSGDTTNVFVDETMPSGAVVHSCLRRIAVNPVTGTTATAVAVLTVSEPEEGTSYANIAKALAADYFNLFYVNANDETFFEYSSKAGEEKLTMERHGDNFFARCREDAYRYIAEEDCERFIGAFTKENVLVQIDEKGFFAIDYRLLTNDGSVYVNMKAMRMQGTSDHIIIGVRSIDAQMKEKEKFEKMRSNARLYTRMMALSGNYLSMYAVDVETDDYNEYMSDESFNELGLENTEKDFFVQAHKNIEQVLPEDEIEWFREHFTKEKIMAEIKRRGFFRI